MSTFKPEARPKLVHRESNPKSLHPEIISTNVLEMRHDFREKVKYPSVPSDIPAPNSKYVGPDSARVERYLNG